MKLQRAATTEEGRKKQQDDAKIRREAEEAADKAETEAKKANGPILFRMTWDYTRYDSAEHDSDDKSEVCTFFSRLRAQNAIVDVPPVGESKRQRGYRTTYTYTTKRLVIEEVPNPAFTTA
jgi:hypothetical protein